jgi:hypothetical protein
MFADLTDAELSALYIKMHTGRDRAYYSTGIPNTAVTFLVGELNGIMQDIHDENVAR